MTGWTDEARAASLSVREAEAKDHNANGKAPGQETHHAAMKGATNLDSPHPPGHYHMVSVPYRIAAQYHAAMATGKSVPAGIAARYHAAVEKMNATNAKFRNAK